MIDQLNLRTRICFIVSLTLGVAMIVTASVIYTKVFPKIVLSKIDKELVIINNTETLERFEHSDVPTYMKFYLFNVSNKDEVNEKGAKPVLEELGPYVYRIELERQVEGWDNDQGTIRYKEVPTYYFEPETSKGTLEDVVNHVNLVSVGMISSTKLDMLQSFTKTNKSEMIENAPGQLVESHRVDDLLFQGIDIKEYMPPFNQSSLNLETVCMFVDNCKFAFFLGKNGTGSKLYEVKTGAPPGNSSDSLLQSMNHYKEIVGYDGERNLTYWGAPSCNALNGTDGTQFPPGVDRRKRLYIFNTEVCRSLYLEYEKNEDVESIGSFRYVIPASCYASPAENPDNWCFFPENIPKDLWSLGGALPVAPCYDGYPVMASSPHFYMGAPRYREDFVGLNPQKDLHESFLDVEPMTGTTISAAKRLQINMRIDPDARPKFLRFINRTIVFPLFWAEQVGIIDQKNVKLLNDKLFTPYKAGKWSLVALMVLGCLVPVVLILVFAKIWKTKKNHPTSNRHVSIDEQNGKCALNNYHRTTDQQHIPTLGMAIKENRKNYTCEENSP